MTTWSQQVKVLVRHHLLVMRRRWGITALHAVAPWAFVAMLLLVQRATDVSSLADLHPPTTAWDRMSPCQPAGECVSFAYFPSNDATNDIMTHVAQANDLTIGLMKDYSAGVWAFPDRAAVIANVKDHPSEIEVVVGFVDATNYAKYEIWYNRTLAEKVEDEFYRAKLVTILNAAVLSYSVRNTHPNGANFGLSTRYYPELAITEDEDPDALSEFGLIFFYGALMFSFAVMLNQMVYYKHTGVKGMFKLMGIRDSAYLFSWFIPNLIIALYSAVVIIILGTALNLPMFRADFGVIFLCFFLTAVANVLFAMFTSTLVTDIRASVVLTGGMFAFGLLFAFINFDGFAYEFYDSYGLVWMRIVFLQFFPWYNFMRIYSDIWVVTKSVMDPKTGEYSEGPGFQFGDLQGAPEAYHYGNGKIDTPPTVDSIYLLLMNIAVYIVLTWYFDAVRRNKNGRARDCCFCCSTRYWGRTRPDPEPQLPPAAFFFAHDATTDADVVEETDRVLQNRLSANHTVRIMALTKQYPRRRPCTPGTQALKGTSFAAERGQVLAIIGPAGAGKTTLFNILSGTIPSGTGEAYVGGNSITQALDWIQSSMGVCQQYDVLLKGLTVKEHLKLSADLRGVPAADVARDINEKMRELDLTSYADIKVENLSGGTRRRLSVGMACLGDSQLILLDEPTSGLDPMNRSRVYAMLDRLKQNRTVIISTHSMEDADKVADRIVMLDQGVVKSVGHPLALKTKLGAGYKISVTATDEEAEKTITKNLKRIVPKLTVSNEGGAVVFGVPMSHVDSMSALCQALETASGVESWGVSQTTLMDVFVKMSSTPAVNVTVSAPNVPIGSASTSTAAATPAPIAIAAVDPERQSSSAPPPVMNSGSFLFGWRAVAHKNGALQRRRYKTNCFLILVTVIMFLIIGPINLVVSSDGDWWRTFRYSDFRPTPSRDYYENPCDVIWSDNMVGYNRYFYNTSCAGAGIVYAGAPPEVQTTPPTLEPRSISIRLRTLLQTTPPPPPPVIKQNRTSMVWFINPPSGGKLGTWNGKTGTGMLGRFSRLVTIGVNPMVEKSMLLYEIDDAVNVLEEQIVDFKSKGNCYSDGDFSRYEACMYGTDIFQPIFPGNYLYTNDLDPTTLLFNFTIGGFGYQMNGHTTATAYRVAQAVNHHWSLAHNTFEFAVWLQNAFVSEFTDTGLHFNIGFRTFLSSGDSFRYYLKYYTSSMDLDSMGMMSQFTFPFVMSFVLVVFVENFVYEKEQRLTETMKMMGLRTTTYYLVNYAFNYVVYLVLALFFVIMGLAWQFHFFIQTSPLVYIVLILLWGHTMCALAFFISALFSSTRRAVAFTYIMLFMLITLQYFISAFFWPPTDGNYVRTTTNPPFLLLFVFPPLTFYRGIYVINQQLGYCSECLPLAASDTFTGEMGRVNGMLFLEAIVFTALGLYLQYVMPRQYGVRRSACFCLDTVKRRLGMCETAYRRVGVLAAEVEDARDGTFANESEMEPVTAADATNEDEDVAAMRQLVARRQYAANCPLVLENLTKAYRRDQVVLNGLALAIDNGECFCLLGPNGAGKSTLINLLTGLIEPTSGTAYVCGYNIQKEIQKAYASVGVCPQDDAVWPDLTVRDHLLFYARLTGLRKPLDRLHVDQRLVQFGLLDVAETRVKTLSRGTIRRLSVAIAFTGWRRVIFLDEPTNGLDPASRLPIWRMIEAAKRDHCIVMNTHSMDEAETLATTVGILSQGKLMCIGTRDHLRAKFGKGYRLEISAVNADRLGEAEVFVRSVAPGAELVSNVSVHSVFEVPRDSLRLSTIFEQMQAGAEAAGIAHWTITQSSLDEVFRKVVATDEAHQEAVAARL